MVARYTATIATSMGKLFTLTHINFAFATNSVQDKVRGGCQGTFLSNVKKKKKKEMLIFYSNLTYSETKIPLSGLIC